MPCVENGLRSPVQLTRAAPCSTCSRCAPLSCATNSWGSALSAVPTAPLGAQGHLGAKCLTDARGTFLQGVTAMPAPAQTGAGYSQQVHPRTPRPAPGRSAAVGEGKGTVCPSVHPCAPPPQSRRPRVRTSAPGHRESVSRPEHDCEHSASGAARARRCSPQRASRHSSPRRSRSERTQRVRVHACVRAHGCAGVLLARQ